MKRVLLVANSDRQGSVSSMESLAAWLHGRAEVAGCVVNINAPLDTVDADAVVAFGGDGTILHVARRLGTRQVPVMGVNLGRLGYLAAVSPGAMREGVMELLEGRSAISRRIMVRARMHVNGRVAWEAHGLNDAVVMSGTPGRIGEWVVTCDGRPLTTFRGDGIVFSTPTGSTAYSLSAGGPILSPEMEALVFTPVCPHELANRPLVVSRTEVLRVRPTAGHSWRLAVDGVSAPAENWAHGELEVCVSERVFLLVHRGVDARYDILRRKLGWGGSVNLNHDDDSQV